MSNYDPFRLYSRSQAKSYKGQVLRKKYYPSHNLTLSDDDYKRVIDTLISQGYRVFPPGRPLPSEPELIFKNLVYIYDSRAIQLHPASDHFIAFEFAPLWESLFPSFEPLLGEDLSRVSDFSLTINILSITYSGSISFDNTQNGVQFQFYFQDPLSILLVPDNPFQFIDDNNCLISLDFFNQSQYRESFILDLYPTNTIRYAQSDYVSKLENLNNQYLYTYTYTDLSILGYLSSKDYNSFNPELYHVATGGSRTGNTIVGDTSIVVQVHLQYKLSS